MQSHSQKQTFKNENLMFPLSTVDIITAENLMFPLSTVDIITADFGQKLYKLTLNSTRCLCSKSIKISVPRMANDLS